MERTGRDFFKRRPCVGKVEWLGLRECHTVDITYGNMLMIACCGLGTCDDLLSWLK